MKKFIYDSVFKTIQIKENCIKELINSPEFQKLRKIKQLDFIDSFFPSANHTRYSHCLGVYHIISKIADYHKKSLKKIIFKLYCSKNKCLSKKCNNNLKCSANNGGCFCCYCRWILYNKIAGLLHDVGHGPFSHMFEYMLQESFKIKNYSHEKQSIKIIKNSKIILILKKYLTDFEIKKICSFIVKKNKNEFNIISNIIDVDRLEYIIRDSKISGVIDGSLNINYFISIMDFIYNDKTKEVELLFKEKSVSSLNSFMNSRILLYNSLYYYKGKLLYKFVFIQLFNKLYSIWNTKKNNEEEFLKLSGLSLYNFELLKPLFLNNLEDNETIPLDKFIKYDDYFFFEIIKQLQYSKNLTIFLLAKVFNNINIINKNKMVIKYHLKKNVNCICKNNHENDCIFKYLKTKKVIENKLFKKLITEGSIIKNIFLLFEKNNFFKHYSSEKVIDELTKNKKYFFDIYKFEEEKEYKKFIKNIHNLKISLKKNSKLTQINQIIFDNENKNNTIVKFNDFNNVNYEVKQTIKNYNQIYIFWLLGFFNT